MPDEMLTPDQQEQKRRQRLAKTIASEMPSKKNKPEKKLVCRVFGALMEILKYHYYTVCFCGC